MTHDALSASLLERFKSIIMEHRSSTVFTNDVRGGVGGVDQNRNTGEDIVIVKYFSRQREMLYVDLEMVPQCKVVVRCSPDAPASSVMLDAVFSQFSTTQKAPIFFDMSLLESAGSAPSIE